MKPMKKYQAIELMQEGKTVEALKIIKTFKREFTKEQFSTITRAFEMTVNPTFYQQLGFNAEEQLQKAEAIVKEVYAEHFEEVM